MFVFFQQFKVLNSLVMLTTLMAVLAPAIDAAKILAVYVYPGRSHFMMHRVLISELVKHGHEVGRLGA